MRIAAVLVTIAMVAGCGQSGDSGNGTAAAPGAGPLADSSAGVTLQPGQWETTMHMEVPGMANLPPGVTPPTMRPVTSNVCITPEQAANPRAEAMSGNAQGSGCRTESFSFANGRIQGASVCERDGVQARTTMTGQYTPTSYEMTIQSETQVGGTTQNSTMRVTARRIGDCPAN